MAFHRIRRLLSFASMLNVLSHGMNRVAPQRSKNTGESATKHYNGQSLFAA
jgi:hypothetical protein